MAVHAILFAIIQKMMKFLVMDLVPYFTLFFCFFLSVSIYRIYKWIVSVLNITVWLYVDHHARTRYIVEDLIRKVSGKDELESIISLNLTLAKDVGKIKVI